MSGRPLTRTSCLVEPKRDELPAASTTTWMWLASVASVEVTPASTLGEEPDGECRDHADSRDHGGLAGHFRECRAGDDFQHHKNCQRRQRQDGDAGEQARHTTVSAD